MYESSVVQYFTEKGIKRGIARGIARGVASGVARDSERGIEAIRASSLDAFESVLDASEGTDPSRTATQA